MSTPHTLVYLYLNIELVDLPKSAARILKEGNVLKVRYINHRMYFMKTPTTVMTKELEIPNKRLHSPRRPIRAYLPGNHPFQNIKIIPQIKTVIKKNDALKPYQNYLHYLPP